VVVVDLQVFFFAARFVLLTCLAYFGALAVNSTLALWLTPPPYTLQSEGSLPPPVSQSRPPLSSYAVIHTHDIFNAVKAPVQSEGLVVAPSSNGAFTLWGTALNEGQRAFAILEDQGTHTQKLYREGEEIAPGVMLVQVSWDRVIVERDGRQEILMLSPESLPTATQPTPMVAASTTPAAARTEEKDGVRQIAQDTFQINRREVEHAMNNLSTLFTQARAVPYSLQEGVTQGFRLSSIKPDSLVDRIGLKNGDIIQRVNGVELADPSTAFTLLQDLQGLSQVHVDVLRNHQPITLSYEIR
jgi:general secretion pathway protein C